VTGRERPRQLRSKAISHLARRALSRAELRRRLKRWGDPREIEQTLQDLEQLGLLNDAQTAYNYALHCIHSRGWGPLRVRNDLVRRGFAGTDVDRALARVSDETGESAVLDGYLRRRFSRSQPPSGRAELLRLYRHLRRRGFRAGLIQAALRRLVPASSWTDLETGE